MKLESMQRRLDRLEGRDGKPRIVVVHEGAPAEELEAARRTADVVVLVDMPPESDR